MSFSTYLRSGLMYTLLCFFAFSAFAEKPVNEAPDAFGVVLEEFPDNRHFYPRNLYNNKGNAILKGKIYGISGYDQVRVKFYKNDNLEDVYEQTLSFGGNLAYFDFNIPINAEMTNHKIELYGVDNGIETLEASADEIVAGDAYVINGQSNAVAAASIYFADLDPFMRSYTNANGWVYINQSFPGQWGGRLAKRIMDEQGVPVAIFNDAQGAQQISYFKKNYSSPTSGNYGAQKSRLDASGVGDRARAMIWFQGEADSWSLSTDEYKAAFEELYNNWNIDYNFEEVYIFQTRYKACSSDQPYVLEAHRQLADEISGLHIMSSNNTYYDGCHFPYSNGYKVLGDRIYGLIKRDMYNGTSSNVTSPDVSNITVTNNQITIQMSGTNQLTQIGNPWADFELEGGSVSITSGSVSGSTIKLNLSGEAAGVTGVSYLGHPNNADNWIVNPKDIGIVCFYDFPIDNPIADNGGGNTGGGGNNGGGNNNPIDCDNIIITTVAGGVKVEGLDEAPISQVQVFDANWSTTYSCANNCAATENIDLEEGTYYVYVRFYNSSWSQICQANETISVSGGGGTPVTDADNDGVPADQDCDDNDPNLPATPGTSCNDNNSTTTDDIIQSDGCTCEGTTSTGGGGNTGGGTDCDNITVNADGTTITIGGLGTAPVSKVQVFDQNWSIVFSCYGNCDDTEIIALSEGLYRVRAALNNSSWQEICEINEELTLENGTTTGGGTTGGGNNGGGGTTSAGVDLELSMTVAEAEYDLYDYINYTLTLENNGDGDATGVDVENKLPSGTVYSSHVSSTGGDYNPWNGRWTVGDVDAGGTAILELRLFVLEHGEDIKNFAQVLNATGDDADSTPGNNSGTNPSEDDEATVNLTAVERSTDPIGIQLSQSRFLVIANLYPNPTNDKLNLQLTATENAVEEIQLFDSFGSLKMVKRIDLIEGYNHVTLDVSELPTGVYSILFDTNGSHHPIRFVKQRL
ncbi:MAG: T9SS type A sorting domain-containing protein [Saprospiraceae bacterium]